MASLSLVRGFLLSPSRDCPRAALQCPSSSSSAPGHQPALVLYRAKQHHEGSCVTCLPSLPSFLPQACKNYLWPSEKTDIVLTAIEAMRDCSTYDKQVASGVLNMIMREPASWLTDVSSL